MQIVLLAGGLATRIKSITSDIPKSLIPIHGKVFLEWQFDLLKINGFNKIVICASHKSEMLREYISGRPNDGLDILLSYDGPHQLGTGGAIVNALPILEDTFCVMYGDSYLPIDFRKIEEYFLKSNLDSLMTIVSNVGGVETSNVHFERGIIKLYDKEFPVPEMEYIDFGLNFFKKRIFQNNTPGLPLDLSQIQKELSLRNLLSGYVVQERYYEVGSFQGIDDFTEYTRRF